MLTVAQLAPLKDRDPYLYETLKGLSGLFGVDSNLLARGLGIPPELLNARANASRSNGGFFSSLGSTLGSAVGALPSAFL